MATNTKEAKVETPCSAYMAMFADWHLVDDLLGGTDRMRAAAENRLPQEPAEENDQYQVRLERSFLYEAYGDTIDRILAKPFSRPVDMDTEVLPDKLKPLATNMDNEGRDKTAFCKDLLKDALSRGLSHVLVEFPQTRIVDENGATEPLSKAEERDLGVRPYFVHIKAENLIGWRWRKADSGEKVLTQIRIKETKIEPDGAWGDKEVNYIRVINEDGTWELHQQNEKDGEYVPIDGGLSIGTPGIPLVTLYTNQTGFMTGKPPLMKLAWKNLEHWQKSSDYSNYCHFAGIGIVFGSGMNAEEQKQKLLIGVNQKFFVQSKDASLDIKEHTGQAAGIQRDAIQDIVEQMIMFGQQPFVRRTGNVTATGEAIDESKHTSDVRAWVAAENSVIVQGLKLAADWDDKELPDGYAVKIYDDFGIGLKAAEDIKNLILSRMQKQIDHETFLKEVKRRGLIGDDSNIEEIIAAVENEGPDMSGMGNTDTEDEPEETEE